jgi:hypothetical protein
MYKLSCTLQWHHSMSLFCPLAKDTDTSKPADIATAWSRMQASVGLATTVFDM